MGPQAQALTSTVALVLAASLVGSLAHFADGIIPRGVRILRHEALKPGRFPYLPDVYIILHLSGHLDVGVSIVITLRCLGCCHRGGTLENTLLASCVPVLCPFQWTDAQDRCVNLNVELSSKT